jgi:hypothetical protein
MPYIPGTPGITDVYNSPNVYANNVEIALWLAPAGTGAFGLSLADVTITLPAPDTSAAIALIADYTDAQVVKDSSGNPVLDGEGQPVISAAPNQYYQPEAAAGGVKGNYQPPPAPASPSSVPTGKIASDPTASDIIPFLQARLSEATTGKWRETGQGGKASNPNITGIWTNLGYSGNPWTTDQTAWCMGWINYTLKNSGYRYVQTASAALITTNPEKWNAKQVPKEQAQPGDIAFWSYRHVNFIYTANNGKYTFVGGNQSPKASNNPNDGDLTISYPGGTAASNGNWVSCWRPSKT